MKKLLSLLMVVNVLSAPGVSVIACGNSKHNDNIINGLEIEKEFHKKVGAFFNSSYIKNKAKLNKVMKSSADDDDSFPYLKKKLVSLAKQLSGEYNDGQLVDVSGVLDYKEIISDLTSPNAVFNDGVLKEYVNDLITSVEFSILNVNNGNSYLGLSVSPSSCQLKFAKSKETKGEFSQISLSFSIELSWFYNNAGVSDLDYVSLPISFQLVNNQLIVDEINEVSNNISSQMFESGYTRFISELKKDVEKNKSFRLLGTTDDSSIKIFNKLKNVYKDNYLESALLTYLKDKTTFNADLKSAFEKLPTHSDGYSFLSLNTDNVDIDEKGSIEVSDDYSITNIGETTTNPSQPGIKYDSKFWGLWAGNLSTNENAYKNIDDLLKDDKNVKFRDSDFGVKLDNWLEKNVESNASDVSESTALAYGNILVKGLALTSDGVSFDLGTIFLDYNYSNSYETKSFSKDKTVSARDFYYEKLIWEEIKEFRKVLGVEGTGEVISKDDQKILTASKDSDSAKSVGNDIKSFISTKDAITMANYLGVDLVSDHFNFNRGKIWSPYGDQIQWTKSSSDDKLSWVISIGDITYRFDLTDALNYSFHPVLIQFI